VYFKPTLRSAAILACLLPGASFAVTAIPTTVTGGISFENPALLNQVENTEVQIGTTFVPYDKIDYDGTVAGLTPETTVSGKPSSNVSAWLSYFRIAQRFNDKWVMSLDVTQPLAGKVDWGPDSIMRTRTNYLNIENYETAARVSYQATSKFALGGSARVTHVTQYLNFGYPPEFGGLYADQNSEGYGVGWSAAGSYAFSEANILSLAYYSRIDVDTKGNSAAGPYSSNNFETTVTEPAEWDLDYFHAFSQQVMATAKVTYAQWSVIKETKLDNVAGASETEPGQPGNLAYPADLNNGLGVQLAGIYALNEKLALFAGGSYNSQVVPDENEDPGFPNYALYSAAMGARYQANKNIAIQPSVAYLWSNGDIHNDAGDDGRYEENAIALGIGLIITC
jgi:long-chain fatty acid transport protein